MILYTYIFIMSSTGKKGKIFVAMSGGVDSSVAAALLKECDFDVLGVHMKCWSDGDYCTSERDAEDARRVAEKLNIPFYVFDFTKEYRERVFDYMMREYAAGRTPNPDVLCNSEIKFGLFLEKALALGADYIATGHYVRAGHHSFLQTDSSFEKAERHLRSQTDSSFAPAANDYLNSRREIPPNGGKPSFHACEIFSNANVVLLTAKDKNKDQSYFLWRLTQDQLKHVLFPIGDYTKQEVREMARTFGLPTSEKKDSQGLCFVGEVNFQDFLREFLPQKTGDVITTSGKKVGEHDGAHFYTIGQRRGIGIGGGIPYYVCEKKHDTNTLVVVEGSYDEKLYTKEILVSDANWIADGSPEFPLECEARIRYRQPLQRCYVHLDTRCPSVGHRVSNMRLNVIFDDPQRAVTPGQSIVFYANGEMLGGGVIF